MLYFPNTRVINSIEYPVASGQVVTQEGVPLTWNVAGQGVQPTAGLSTEKFAGVALNQQYNPVTAPWLDTLTVPSTGALTVTLTNNAVAGTLFVYDTTSGTVITQSVAGNGTCLVTIGSSSTTILFGTQQAGHNMSVSYQYSPTVQQIIGLQGMAVPGTPIATYLGSTGVIVEGVIYTSCYDTTVNWGYSGVQPTTISMGYSAAQGSVFTISTSTAVTVGVSIPSCYVQSIPSNAQPFLGLAFRT